MKKHTVKVRDEFTENELAEIAVQYLAATLHLVRYGHLPALWDLRTLRARERAERAHGSQAERSLAASVPVEGLRIKQVEFSFTGDAS